MLKKACQPVFVWVRLEFCKGRKELDRTCLHGGPGTHVPWCAPQSSSRATPAGDPGGLSQPLVSSEDAWEGRLAMNSQPEPLGVFSSLRPQANEAAPVCFPLLCPRGWAVTCHSTLGVLFPSEMAVHGRSRTMCSPETSQASAEEPLLRYSNEQAPIPPHLQREPWVLPRLHRGGDWWGRAGSCLSYPMSAPHPLGELCLSLTSWRVTGQCHVVLQGPR